MDIEELKQRVLSKNWDALDIVDTAAKPRDAIPALRDLAGNEDPGVRELALNCLALINDPAISGILASALSDEDDDIRLFALQSLQLVYNETIAPELVANVTNEDGEIRSGVALLLGNIGQVSAVQPIEQQLGIEKDEEVKRDLKLALAKLGNSDLKDEFAGQMDVPDSQVRLQGLEDLRYIGDAKLAVRILPALDDSGQAHLITDKNQPEPEFARVCDAAVNLISELCESPFDFEVDEFKVYSDEEIQQAKAYLDSLKSE